MLFLPYIFLGKDFEDNLIRLVKSNEGSNFFFEFGSFKQKSSYDLSSLLKKISRKVMENRYFWFVCNSEVRMEELEGKTLNILPYCNV